MPSPSMVTEMDPSVIAARLKAYDERTEAENYAVYRSVVDNKFIEPVRAGLPDVMAAAHGLRDCSMGARGQNTGFTVLDNGRGVAWVNEHVLPFGPRLKDGTGCVGYETGRLLPQAPVFLRGRDVAEGRTLRLSVSPGVLAARQVDLNRKERTEQRRIEAALAAGALRVAVDDAEGLRYVIPETGEIVFDSGEETGSGRGCIVKWSAKSREAMHRAVGSLDYSDWLQSDGAMAMVTFTLPGDWLAVAPTGGDFKRHMEKMRRRWVRAGLQWRGLWKLEFQKRGAPHTHMLLRVPALVKGRIFEQWLSETWADVVGASKVVDGLDSDGNDSSEYTRHLSAGTRVDFSGADFSDPRRIPMYFAGHSAKHTDGKEYQHIVPMAWRDHDYAHPWACDGFGGYDRELGYGAFDPSERVCARECGHGGAGAGPGRFWGYVGFSKAVVEVDVTPRDYDRARRVLRHVTKARAWTVGVLRERGKAHREGRDASLVKGHAVRGRKVPKSALGGGGGFNGGWVLCNDAIGFAWDLCRVLGDEPCCGGAGCTWCGHVPPSVVVPGWRTVIPETGEVVYDSTKRKTWPRPKLV